MDFSSFLDIHCSFIYDIAARWCNLFYFNLRTYSAIRENEECFGYCRMLESSYNLLFGKLALKCLFDDYFEDARHFSTRVMLKPIDDPHVDLVATVSFLTLAICWRLHP